MNRIIANPLLSLGVALGASAIAALPTMAQSTLSSYPTSAALPDIVALQPISEPTNPDRSIYPNIPAAFGAQPFGISALEPDILPFGNSVVVGYAYSVTGGPKFKALLVPIGALPNAQTQLTLELPGFANQTLVLGTPFNLLPFDPSGFSNFNITGIDPAAGILPTDPALTTGLLFTGPGTATVTQTPIVQEITPVPEPSNLFGLGLLGFGALLQRQLNKKKSATQDMKDE